MHVKKTIQNSIPLPRCNPVTRVSDMGGGRVDLINYVYDCGNPTTQVHYCLASFLGRAPPKLSGKATCLYQVTLVNKIIIFTVVISR